jgi:hypothetical protein
MKYVDTQGVSFVTVLSTTGVNGMSWWMQAKAAVLWSAVEDTLSTTWMHKFPTNLGTTSKL